MTVGNAIESRFAKINAMIKINNDIIILRLYFITTYFIASIFNPRKYLLRFTDTLFFRVRLG